MLTKEIVTDPRLTPLFDDGTITVLQLFVLEFLNKKTSQKEHKIIYGWCLISTRDNAENSWFSSNSEEVFSSEEITCNIFRLSLYNAPAVIINLVNKLLNCLSIRVASTELKIDTSRLKFDVNYISGPDMVKNFVLRPLIFNETNTLLSRNFYEKHSLTSPYKNIPSVSLIINNLDKLGLLTYPEWETSLTSILRHLEEETTLNFTVSGPGRFGNIEFISSQCCDKFENHYVSFKTIKEEDTTSGRERLLSKKIRVTVKPNPYTANKNLIINCFLSNGGQVTLDECRNVFHVPEELLSIDFESQEPLSQIAISIWLNDKEMSYIWYKHSCPILREISSTIGIVGKQGTVKSEWLTAIEKSSNNTTSEVRQAEKISRSSYSSTTTGGYSRDPWVSADREFIDIVARLNPRSGEGAFFSKGWDSVDQEYGALSLLEWFKKVTDQAQKVVIQDPYFDNVGLEFLARTTNSQTEFSVLTCTQVPSEDDEVRIASDRATRLVNFVNSFPSLFNSTRLNIYDLQSIGGGRKNLLHDRYILIFQDDRLDKGFQLSNSIQNATKTYPLLITPIPPDILIKLNRHIGSIINETKRGEVQVVPLLVRKDTNASSSIIEQDVADPAFLEKLKITFPSLDQVTLEGISSVIQLLSQCNEHDFCACFSTLGHFMANVNYSREIMNELKQQFTPELNNKLSGYLRSSLTLPYPIGYVNDTRLIREMHYYSFSATFDEFLKSAVWFHHSWYGITTCGNYGIYYATEILFDTGFEEYIDLVQFLRDKHVADQLPDPLMSPLVKLTTVTIDRLVNGLFWFNGIEFAGRLLRSDITLLRTLTAAALITGSLSSEADYKLSDTLALLAKNLQPNEALVAMCKMLEEYKFQCGDRIDVVIENELFTSIKNFLQDNFSIERLHFVIDKLLEVIYYPQIEQKITDNILLKLPPTLIDKNAIVDLWSSKFFNLQKQSDNDDHSGLLRTFGCFLCIADTSKRQMIVKQLQKQSKKDIGQIRKPFKKGSILWTNAFTSLFRVQTVLAITLLWREEKHSEMDDVPVIQSIISEIKNLQQQFQPYLRNKVQTFAFQIMKEYDNLP